MAELGGSINIEDQAKDYRGEFTVLAPGWYQAVIIKSELKDNKSKNGKILELTYQTTKGQAEVVDRLNLVNPNDIAQRIGRSTLAKIAQDMGISGEISNSNVLHGKPIDIKVVIEKFKSNTSGKDLDSNKISDYRKAGSGSYAAAGETTDTEQPKKASAGGAW